MWNFEFTFSLDRFPEFRIHHPRVALILSFTVRVPNSSVAPLLPATLGWALRTTGRVAGAVDPNTFFFLAGRGGALARTPTLQRTVGASFFLPVLLQMRKSKTLYVCTVCKGALVLAYRQQHGEWLRLVGFFSAFFAQQI